MDGSLALLFGLVAAIDLGFGVCATNDCAPSRPVGQHAVQYGEALFQRERQGREIYVLSVLPARFGRLEPIMGLSVSARGDGWAGAGLQWSGGLPHNSYVQLSLMPGLYARADGPDLGHMIEFRSSAGVGYAFESGARISLQFDHRSNAGLSDPNPGLETFGLRLSLPR